MRGAVFFLNIFGLVLSVGLSPLSPAAAESHDELVIGLIPEMNVFEQVQRYQKLADYIAAQLEIPVRLTMLSRYGNIVDRIVNQDVDAAFLGSFTGALASAQLGWIPLARPINLDDSSTYWGYLFVRQDSGIQEVSQMKQRRMAFVERATTAGYVYPIAYFRQNGVPDVGTFFSEVQFWGSHDSAILAVLEGRADVGAAKNTIWERLSQENPRINAELQILATSPKVPSNGLLVAPRVDAGIREQLLGVLVALGEDPSATEVLQRLRANGFVATDSQSYEPVLDLAHEAGIDLSTYTYENQ